MFGLVSGGGGSIETSHTFCGTIVVGGGGGGGSNAVNEVTIKRRNYL